MQYFAVMVKCIWIVYWISIYQQISVQIAFIQNKMNTKRLSLPVAATEIKSASVIQAVLNCDNAYHRPRLGRYSSLSFEIK